MNWVTPDERAPNSFVVVSFSVTLAHSPRSNTVMPSLKGAVTAMIPKRIRGGALVLSLVLTNAAWPRALAQDVSPLRGEVFVAGKTPIDPPPEESKNSHAYILISGPAALRMYRGMRAKEEPNLCETGKRMKRAGPLSCSMSKDGKNASCDFSVDLIKGALDQGRPC